MCEKREKDKIHMRNKLGVEKFQILSHVSFWRFNFSSRIQTARGFWFIDHMLFT